MPTGDTAHATVRTLTSAVLCLIISGPVSAQPAAFVSQLVAADPEGFRLQLDVGGLIGMPLGDFADNVDTSGGIAVDFGYRLGDTPVWVGGGVGFLSYGSATRQVPLSLTIPDVLVDVTTSNNMLMTHGRLRIQPTAGSVRPYADGLLGFNYLYTETTLDGADTEVLVGRTTNFSDFALSLGGGVGVTVDLVTWSDGRFGLDVGARYVYGADVDYLVPGAQGFDAGVAGLEARRTRADLLLVRLGGVLAF